MKPTAYFYVLMAVTLFSLSACKKCRICSARIDTYYIKVEGSSSDTVGNSSSVFPNEEICGADLEDPIYQDAIIEEFEVNNLKEVRVKYYTCR